MTWSRIGFVAAIAAALTVSAATPARAQAEPVQVTADFKGIIGCGLIGAELGFVVPALAGLDETWAFIVFPVVGAAGGGLLGYFLIEQNDEREIAVASLAVGMALIIPTMVITLSATAYDPEEESTQPQPENVQPAAEDYEVGGSTGGGATTGTTAPGEPPESAPQQTTTPPAEAPQPGPQGRAPSRRHVAQGPGLLRWNEGGLYLGMPAIAVLPTDARTEMRVALVSGVF